LERSRRALGGGGGSLGSDVASVGLVAATEGDSFEGDWSGISNGLLAVPLAPTGEPKPPALNSGGFSDREKCTSIVSELRLRKGGFGTAASGRPPWPHRKLLHA